MSPQFTKKSASDCIGIGNFYDFLVRLKLRGSFPILPIHPTCFYYESWTWNNLKDTNFSLISGRKRLQIFIITKFRHCKEIEIQSFKILKIFGSDRISDFIFIEILGSDRISDLEITQNFRIGSDLGFPYFWKYRIGSDIGFKCSSKISDQIGFQIYFFWY